MSSKARGENEFPIAVQRLIAARAGHACSVPRCKNPTSGPTRERLKAINIGMACHIYSASPRGPRGNGGKDKAFLTSEANGIWCCSQHGLLIDKNQGTSYPAGLLFVWKRLAEARTLKRLDGAPSPLGWVSSISLEEFPSCNLNGLDVNLSRLTLLGGNSGTGKTSLMQIACGISQSSALHRFSHDFGPENADHARVSGTIRYTTVDSLDRTAVVTVHGGAITRSVDGANSRLPPDDISVVGWHDVAQWQRRDEDDLDYLMRVANADDSSLRSLIMNLDKQIAPWAFMFEPAVETYQSEDGEELSRPLIKENGQPYLQLTAKRVIGGRELRLVFAGLSSSEQGRVKCALLIAKAQELSRHRLTLLLLDEVIASFDDYNFERLLKVLSQQEFQSVVCVPPGFARASVDRSQDPPALLSRYIVDGWKLEWLQGRN